jgi:hypothetical protein
MEQLLKRTYDLINQTWTTFIHQVGNGIIEVNKEASMQLNYAYLLRNTLPLIIFDKDEQVEVELERGIPINGRLRECDIIVSITKGEQIIHIPIEMKCYKRKTATGKLRGAQDIFMKDLYEDIELLESYEGIDDYLDGIQLTMTDNKGFVYPKSKESKNWNYDVSNGHIINKGTKLTTPIGGKEVNIKLTGSYQFEWQELNGFYFLKLQNNG